MPFAYQAIQARGLICAGWVTNVIDPSLANPQAYTSILQSIIPAPQLAHIGYQQHLQQNIIIV